MNSAHPLSAPLLRDVIEADLPLFFDHQRDPIAAQMAAFVPRERDAFMAHWHDKVLADPANATKTVVVDGRAAGHVASWDQDGKRLVGYWIGREHWGKGIATRALMEFLAHETTRPLYAWVAVDNAASIRVLEKCGFRRDATTGLHTGDDGVVEALMTLGADELARYRVTGMDCPSCVRKIETAASRIAGARDVQVSLASGLMTLRLDHHAARTEVETVVTGLGYRLDRLDGAAASARDRASEPPSDTSPASPALASPVSPAYRRALWTVVLLNLGYGVVETVAGLFAGSQSLEASALDFLGDGGIALLGLVAVGWSAVGRARAALFQGTFLGLFGLGVLVTSLARVFVPTEPQAEAMGLFGGLAMAVNVAAAAILVPHRAGDANIRAVWLDSRNDAIGNVAVVLAAGLVAWTGTPWPDLVVAVAIAGLFLHSSWSIVMDARRELARATAPR